jgi:hypothetical protein
MSPTAPVTTSGTATINRTLLHTQQFTTHSAHHPRNGNPRGLANHLNGDSPPPNYDDVHDISLQRHGFFLLLFPFLSSPQQVLNLFLKFFKLRHNDAIFSCYLLLPLVQVFFMSFI